MRALTIVPQVRSHVPPFVIEALAAQGYHVHRIGAAAYVHGDAGHFLFGVWRRRDPSPTWADRLGDVSAGYLRRAHRLDHERRGRRYVRDGRGRFLARLPWYRIPPVQVHAFEPARRSLVAQEEHLAAERRAELQKRGYWA